MTGKKIQHYEVLERLGGGGMGVVYKARDTRLDRLVALKFLPPHLSSDPDANARFTLEAKAASALDHENICTLHDVGETEDGRLFLAMGYYRGKTLKQMLAEGPLPVDTAVDLGMQLAAGLERAHEAGIIHRDIKSANIIVTERGQLKILDFGLAKLAGQDLTVAGSTLGTVAYMSPEQARGETLDHRTDLWSTGIVLYEMLTGETPFRADYEQAQIYSILNSDIPELDTEGRSFPPGLEDIVAVCLRKNAKDRYSSAAELHRDLKAIRNGMQPTVSGAPVTRSFLNQSGGIRIRPLALVGAVIAILSLILVLFLWMQPGDERQLLAVIPFEVTGENPEREVLADGLQQSITSQLSRLVSQNNSFWVLPASEILTRIRSTEARDQLGVDMAVEGRIEVSMSAVRLFLDLVDTSVPRVIESEQIDYTSKNAFQLQDEAVSAVARMLDIAIDPSMKTRLTAGGTVLHPANDHYLRGLGYLRDSNTLGSIEKAIDAFRLAVEEDPEFVLAHAALGEAYARHFEQTEDITSIEAASTALASAVSIDSTLAQVHLTAGLVHETLGQYEEALESFEKGLASEPEDVELLRRKGISLRRLNRMDEAETAFLDALKINPDYWRTSNSLANLYRLQGKPEAARQLWSDTVKRYPSNVSLVRNLGVAHYELGNFEEANRQFERVLQLEPNDRYAWNNIGTGFYYLGEFKKAEEAFRKQADVRPDVYATYSFIGDCLYWSGEKTAAKTFYRRSVSMALRQYSVAPNDGEVAGDLAGYYFRLEKPDSLRFFLDKLASSFPDESAVTAYSANSLVGLYEMAGDRDTALRWLPKALEGDVSYDAIKYSPWLKDLRNDARYKSIIGRLRPE